VALLVDHWLKIGGLDCPHLVTIGISFYTFHAITLAVDTYRGKVNTRVSLLDVALYIAFFPQLVAGPIVRATVLLPQLATKRQISGEDLFVATQVNERADSSRRKTTL